MAELHNGSEKIIKEEADESQYSKLDLNSIRKRQRQELKEIKKQRINEGTKIKKENAFKQMKYLLQHSEKYSQYILKKLHTQQRKGSQSEANNNSQDNILDDILNSCDKENSESTSQNKLELKYFTGTLHSYQVDGLNWLKVLYENSTNGILADEMGLGKTIQVIALICHLIEMRIKGPFLIVAPLSTLPNWVSEFQRFAPKIPVVLFYGTAEQRAYKYQQIQKKHYVDDFRTRPVVITSFQIPVSEGPFLRAFHWQYIIIDEGQRIKNFECRLIIELRRLTTANRLILTGTPLQNNLTELWSLLNFLLPEFFQDKNTFESLLQLEDFEKTDTIIEQEQSSPIISTIHGVLKPFMLRRLKSDVWDEIVPKKEVLVYCPLSDLQSELYQYVLQRNITKLLGNEEEETSKEDTSHLSLLEGRKRRKCASKIRNYNEPMSDDDFEDEEETLESALIKSKTNESDEKAFIYYLKMANPSMVLKNIVNHPFIIRCPVYPGTKDIVINENIVTQCGKMMVLDALLIKLKELGHKVLLFCTLTTVLDFIEDYMHIRGHGYSRLDGRTKYESRRNNIDAFNTDPNIFVFLISTRAGSLGLNLTAADTVILYDRDWNPQVDIQAQDRCHRIGQTKPVIVYSLISIGTIDEAILKRGQAKRRLEKIVIKKGKFTNSAESFKSVNDLKELQELLNSVEYKQVIHSNGLVLTDEQLNTLVDRSDLYTEMKQRKKKKKLLQQ